MRMRIRIKISPLIPREAANKAAVDEEEDKTVDKNCPDRIIRAKPLIIRKKTRTWKVLIRMSIVAK